MESTPCAGFNVGNLKIEINNSRNRCNKVESHMEYKFYTKKRRKKRTYNGKKK